MIFILFFELDRMWNFVTTKIIYNTSSSWEKRDTTWEMWIVDFITFVKPVAMVGEIEPIQMFIAISFVL